MIHTWQAVAEYTYLVWYPKCCNADTPIPTSLRISGLKPISTYHVEHRGFAWNDSYACTHYISGGIPSGKRLRTWTCTSHTHHWRLAQWYRLERLSNLQLYMYIGASGEILTMSFDYLDMVNHRVSIYKNFRSLVQFYKHDTSGASITITIISLPPYFLKSLQTPSTHIYIKVYGNVDNPLGITRNEFLPSICYYRAISEWLQVPHDTTHVCPKFIH